MAITEIVLMICDDCDIVCQAQEGDVTCIQCGKPMTEEKFIRAKFVAHEVNKFLRKSQTAMEYALDFIENALDIKR